MINKIKRKKDKSKPVKGFSSEEEYESIHGTSSEEEIMLINDKTGDEKAIKKQQETVLKCCYENQRYWVLTGWSQLMGGALERASWSDAKGSIYLPKQNVKLEKGWEWAGNWFVVGRDVRSDYGGVQDYAMDHDDTYDRDGWQYSTQFVNRFSGV